MHIFRSSTSSTLFVHLASGVQDIWLSILASVLGLVLFMLVLMLLSSREAEPSNPPKRQLTNGRCALSWQPMGGEKQSMQPMGGDKQSSPSAIGCLPMDRPSHWLAGLHNAYETEGRPGWLSGLQGLGQLILFTAAAIINREMFVIQRENNRSIARYTL